MPKLSTLLQHNKRHNTCSLIAFRCVRKMCMQIQLDSANVPEVTFIHVQHKINIFEKFKNLKDTYTNYFLLPSFRFVAYKVTHSALIRYECFLFLNTFIKLDDICLQLFIMKYLNPFISNQRSGVINNAPGSPINRRESVCSGFLCKAENLRRYAYSSV